MIEKFLVSRGDTSSSTSLRSSISTHSKNYSTRKLSSSSLHHSLDSCFGRALAGKLQLGKGIVRVGEVARFHGNMQVTGEAFHFHYLSFPLYPAVPSKVKLLYVEGAWAI